MFGHVIGTIGGQSCCLNRDDQVSGGQDTREMQVVPRKDRPRPDLPGLQPVGRLSPMSEPEPDPRSTRTGSRWNLVVVIVLAPYRFFTNGSEPSVLKAMAATNHSRVPSKMRSSMISPTKPKTMHARARIVQIIGSPPSSRAVPISQSSQSDPDEGRGPQGWCNTKLTANGTRRSGNRRLVSVRNKQVGRVVRVCPEVSSGHARARPYADARATGSAARSCEPSEQPSSGRRRGAWA